MRVVIIGTGYVGSVTGVGLAAQGHHVMCTDVDEKKIDAWNSEVLPLSEPGLLELVTVHRGRNLFFSTDLSSALKDAEFVFVCVNTPTKVQGVNRGGFDMRFVDSAARLIARYASDGVIVVEKSTVPLRTAEQLDRVMRANFGGKRFAIVSNPEFLAEGTAVTDFLKPDRILIGTRDGDDWARDKMATLYAWAPKECLVFSDIWSSELAKLANNLSLVMRLTTMNSLSELCERTGADVTRVAGVVGMDSRLGSYFLRAGVGFGGSCFYKDVSALVYLMEYYFGKENPYGAMFESALAINNHLRARFVQVMNYHLHSVGSKTIALLGLAFKPDTDDVRDAPAVAIAKYLLEDGAILHVVDPCAAKHVPSLFVGFEKQIKVFDSAQDAVRGAHAIVLVTEWDVFASFDFKNAASSMHKPAWVFDGRNMFDPEKVTSAGLNYYGVGRGVFFVRSRGRAWVGST